MRNFNQVWHDLNSLLRHNPVIYTLSQNKPNEVVEITTEGLMVKTTGKPKLVKKEWIKAAWECLGDKKSMTADDLSGTARYRSSFIMALLSQLDYVGVKNASVATLVLQQATVIE